MNTTSRKNVYRQAWTTGYVIRKSLVVCLLNAWQLYCLYALSRKESITYLFERMGGILCCVARMFAGEQIQTLSVSASVAVFIFY